MLISKLDMYYHKTELWFCDKVPDKMAHLTVFMKLPISEVSHSYSESYTDTKWYILTHSDNMPCSYALLNDWGVSFSTINEGFLVFVTVLTFPGLFLWLFLSSGQLIQEEITCQKHPERLCCVRKVFVSGKDTSASLIRCVFVYVIKALCEIWNSNRMCEWMTCTKCCCLQVKWIILSNCGGEWLIIIHSSEWWDESDIKSMREKKKTENY